MAGPAPETTDSDRSWWKAVYRSGLKASIYKEPRVPPSYLTPEQQEVWLAGYDR